MEREALYQKRILSALGGMSLQLSEIQAAMGF